MRKIPGDRCERIIRALDEMEQDPFSGDVKTLQGPAWSGRYRKRVGDYRIIFSVNRSLHRIDVSAILIRSEKTYR